MQDLFDLVIFIECKSKSVRKGCGKKGFPERKQLHGLIHGGSRKKIKLVILCSNNDSLKQLNKKIDSLIIILERICFIRLLKVNV